MMLREKFPCDEDYAQDERVDIRFVRQIYWKMGDAYSRSIFENRLMYSLTGDYIYIGKILTNTNTGRKIRKMLESFLSIYIYGAGVRGKLLVEMYCDVEWKGFIDQKKSGTYLGVPIYSMDDIIFQQEDRILISNACNCDEIIYQLTEKKKVARENIILLNDCIKHTSDDIYFDPKYIRKHIMNDKMLLDLGCFDGRDTIRAINYFSEDNMQICALEPDNSNYENCVYNLRDYTDKVILQRKGIGRRREIGNFEEGGFSARFSKKGKKLVELDTIDDIADKQDVGFIKMDIEGYEEPAIVGGEKTIIRCSPVIAVSVYHKRSDIWKIPMKLLELNPGYRFYLEHYSFGWDDTVLYAISD